MVRGNKQANLNADDGHQKPRGNRQQGHTQMQVKSQAAGPEPSQRLDLSLELPALKGPTQQSITTPEGMKAAVAKVMEELSNAIDQGYKDQLNTAFNTMGDSINKMAKQHYDDVSKAVEASKKAIEQARGHHKRVLSEVHTYQQELAQMSDTGHRLREAVESITGEVNARCDQIRKKFKLAA